jgi:ribosomal protein S18 acetylase RimI-like enzyme
MVELIPMTEEQFHAYLGLAIADYAQDIARAGNVAPDLATEVSEQQFQSLLPDGLDTPDQSLYAIYDPIRRKHVGHLWFGIRDEGGQTFAALYDFAIFEAYRRQGYGTQALQALEQQVRARGLDEIRLHVFGHNHPARALYEKMGYVPTNITMAKQL